jgi:hypothetical protein
MDPRYEEHVTKVVCKVIVSIHDLRKLRVNAEEKLSHIVWREPEK